MKEKRIKDTMLQKISELIYMQHLKMDGPITVNHDIKLRYEGYLEALYQVEKIIFSL